MKVVAIGPGMSSLAYKEVLKETSLKKLALQEVFPNCVEGVGIIPDYWVCGDPHAYLDGFRELLNEETDKYKNMKIMMPRFFTSGFAQYRRHCGTTPLMRMERGFELFHGLLSRVEERYDIEYFDATTTKYLKTFPNTIPDEDLFSDDAYYRFMHSQPIWGTVEFDSESVIGETYKWGLETKLSSVVLPMCYYLGAKSIYVVGFDMIGPRFYSNVTRQPHNDETQMRNERAVAKIPLKMLEKWIKWKEFHGMEIMSIASDEHTLLNSVLEYTDEREILD